VYPKKVRVQQNVQREHVNAQIPSAIKTLNPQNPAGNSTLNTANKPSRIIIRKKG
jgi:hypothetical protein